MITISILVSVQLKIRQRLRENTLKKVRRVGDISRVRNDEMRELQSIFFLQNMSKKCDRHQFCLKPKTQSPINPQNLNASFCGKTKTSNSEGEQAKKECLNCPTFNTDGNYATPAFILGWEQGKEEEQGKKMREQHQRRMINYTDEKTELNVPKPRSKNSYCSVCQHDYQDYMDHIKSAHHKKRISHSLFNRHILQLVKKFAENKEILKKAQEEKELDDDDSVEIISNPQKKIKPSESITHPYTSGATNFRDCRLPSPPVPSDTIGGPYRPVPLVDCYNFNMNMSYFMNNPPHNHSIPYAYSFPPEFYPYDYNSFMNPPCYPSKPWLMPRMSSGVGPMAPLGLHPNQMNNLPSEERMKVPQPMSKHIQIIVIDD